MSDNYKIKDKDKPYYLTLTVINWIDVFTRTNQKLLITNSLDYCIKNKGLVVYAYVIMPNHIHMICKAEGEQELSEILRDFKTYTSKKIIEQIEEEPESRKDWMLKFFSEACSHLKRNQNYKVWQDGNQAKEIFSTAFLYEKLEYIHNNPVKDMIVEKPEDYLFSSARNYAELDSYVDVFVLDHKPLITNWK